MTSLNAPQHTLPDGRKVLPDAVSRSGRLTERLRLMLGLRRSFVVAGVRYTERSTEPLRRSLSRKGAGLKEYDAAFADGTRLRLHCTPARVYADVSGAVLLPRYRLLEDLLQPGMRVLDLSCGTGYGAAWLVDRVGPSGAVVALDRDRESIKYAQKRYAASNAAFETGGAETLYGELAGGFDAVMALRGLDEHHDLRQTLTELWRVVAPGGWLAIASPTGRVEGGKPRLDPEAEAEFVRIFQSVATTPAAETEAADGSEPAAREAGADAGLTADRAEAGYQVLKLDDPMPERRAVWLAMKARA